MAQEAVPFSIRDRLHSFRNAFKGIWRVLKLEHNFRIHLFATSAVIMAGIYFQIDLINWMFLITACALVLISEILNSAIEWLCDFVSAEAHPHIRYVKDAAAAAVLISAISATVLGILIAIRHFSG